MSINNNAPITVSLINASPRGHSTNARNDSKTMDTLLPYHSQYVAPITGRRIIRLPTTHATISLTDLADANNEYSISHSFEMPIKENQTISPKAVMMGTGLLGIRLPREPM